MPYITSIKPQKKDKKRFNVFLDGKFTFGINVENLVKYKLQNGINLSQKLIDQILKKEEVSKLFDSCLKYLSFRPRSEKEVKNYIAKKISKYENVKFSQAKESSLVETVIKKLKNHKFLDDFEFARWWVEARSKSKPRGIFLIKSELIQKGVEKEIIEQAISNISNQLSLATKALGKKIPRWQNLPQKEFKKKVFSFLSSRGFEFDIIKDVVAHFEKRR